MKTALAKGPPHARSKWDSILDLKGKAPGAINAQKQTFLLKWVSNPEWEDAYFHQSVTFEEKKNRQAERCMGEPRAT